jgi:hypothetical protein
VRHLRAEAQCHNLSEASLKVSFLDDNNKERTETAENEDEQALLALVAPKQKQILG